MSSRKAGMFLRVGSMFMLLTVLTAVASRAQAVALPADSGNDSAFCTTLDKHAKSASDRLQAKSASLNAIWSTQGKALVTLQHSQSQDIGQLRASVDSERSRNIASLREKATSGATRSAVDSYAAALASAVETRRQAVDSARTTYQKALHDDILSRQAARSGQVQALAIKVADAYTVTQNTCIDNGAAVARANLRQALTEATQNFQRERQADTQAKLTVHKQLTTARQTAVKTANQHYQTAVNTARQNLEQAFKSDHIKL